MDEDFLNNFSMEDINFDFNFNEENSPSPDEASMHTQRVQFSSDFDHQINLEFSKEKIDNKPKMISFNFSSNVSPVTADIIMDRCGTKRKECSPTIRSPVLAKEHVLAERKRREKLSEKFIALSALLPGLKKADKITILDKAISRMKQLQEQMTKLEQEKKVKREMDNIVVVKKSKFFLSEEDYLSSPSDNKQYDQSWPEIEAKISQNDILIRIHCEKTKGCMVNILNTIESLQLHIVNSVILPFGGSTLDITVLAQIEKDFSVRVLKDLVKNLRLAIV